MRDYQNCLLDPSETAVLIIDHQPQMFFAMEGVNRSTIMNNIVGLAKTAGVFGVQCILSTVTSETFSGKIYSKLQDVFPDIIPIDRSSLNAWEDYRVTNAIKQTGKDTIIIAGLWTEVCVTFSALSAIEDGYEVFVVTDACGGTSKESHDMALQRMIQVGVKPVTWQQVLLEFQRDWSNKDTYNQVMEIIKQHCGTYGLGVEYSETMIDSEKFAFNL